MKCDCGSNTRTTDTRKIPEGVWRRRDCPTCGAVLTTLEQKCETLSNPYRSSKLGTAVGGKVVAPPVPAVVRPNPPAKRSKATRKPTGAFHPAPADFAPDPTAHHRLAPREASVAVDRVTPTARDRIEDMKADREQSDYGWGK